MLAEVLSTSTVLSTSDFFDDLGADSMVMARFCARVRKRPELPNVAIRDTYEASTVASLALMMAARAAMDDAPTEQFISPVRAETVPEAAPHQDAEPSPVGTLGYLLCGFLQLLFLLGYPALVAAAFAVGAEWVLTSDTALDIYLRSVGMAGGLFLGMSCYRFWPSGCWSVAGRKRGSACGVCATTGSGWSRP